MKFHFRPMPWLTAITAVMFAILISLGVWQFKRLQWKTALLAEVEASVTAPPLTSLEDLERAIAAGEPVDFRRIILSGSAAAGEAPYAVYKTQNGGIYWQIFRLYGTSPTIYASKAAVLDSDKASNTGVPSLPRVANLYDNHRQIGYVRKNHPMGRVESWVKPKYNRDTNRWFKFNQSGDWGNANTIITHYIEISNTLPSPAEANIETVNRASLELAQALPIRRPSIRNNHRDYMLTWFSFAGLLLIFYALIHRRAGRLTW